MVTVDFFRGSKESLSSLNLRVRSHMHSTSKFNTHSNSAPQTSTLCTSSQTHTLVCSSFPLRCFNTGDSSMGVTTPDLQLKVESRAPSTENDETKTTEITM